jgi:hypothetical protein
MGLFSSSVSFAARQTGHEVSFGVTSAMMILVNAFMVYTLKNRRHITPWHKKYGPLMLTIAAAPLILADIFRHLLNDYDVWDVRARNPALSLLVSHTVLVGRVPTMRRSTAHTHTHTPLTALLVLVVQ